MNRATCLVLVLTFLATACASKPTLYPNAHYKEVGEAQAQRDIEDCLRLAEAHGTEKGQAADVAESTGIGAVGGAAVGAVTGAIFGSAGKGAAAGAAGGGTAGLLSGLLKMKDPKPATKAFVDRCLKERGYDPLAWD